MTTEIFPAPLKASPSRGAAAVEQVPVGAIRPDPRNPRLHSKRQIRQIAHSIEAFGFNVPILVDASGTVIAGHGRLLAAQLLGRSEVPAIRLEHLTPVQIQAFLIADNRLTDNSTWDDQLLALNLKELAVQDLDFSVEATGFDMAEIDLRIEQIEEPGEEDDPDDALPEPDQAAVSRPADLWIAGEHRILCGNALQAADYDAVLAGETADVVFTDPPYNVPIDGHVAGKGAIHHREFAMASGEMTPEQFTAFLSEVCRQLHGHSRDGSIHYLCMDWRHLPEILAAGEVFAELKNVCVWAKNNAGMGSLYRSQHELVLVFKKGSAAHVNNVQLGRFGRSRSNIWLYPAINSFGRTTEEGNLLALHPTVKPVAMVADALFDCSNRGDVVLDPFLGSGTTLIAAERVGRRCRGIELDPLYVDTALRRWQRRTRRAATLAATGQTFEAVEAERVGTRATAEGEGDE